MIGRELNQFFVRNMHPQCHDSHAAAGVATSRYAGGPEHAVSFPSAEARSWAWRA